MSEEQKPAPKTITINIPKVINNKDADFITDCRIATLHQKTPVTSLTIYSIFAFFVLALIWSYFAIIDEVTHGEGKVIPPSQLKVIQSLEGGIVSEMLVKEGDDVRKDQILLKIDDTTFASSLGENRAVYYALLGTVTRLTQETEGKDKIIYPPELEKYPDIIKRENKIFETRKMGLRDSVKTLTQSYNFAKQELDITTPLVKEGVMSKVELLRVQRQVNDLKGEISKKEDEFKEKAHQELIEKKREMERYSETLSSLQDKVKRATVRSPVDGTVKKIFINTIGGVIKPGMDIMEIVPKENFLIIQAKVKPSDIAFIKVGQPANVRFTAYDFSIYGGLKGTVQYISADSIIDERDPKIIYFEALVRTDKDYLGTKEHPLPIKVGMISQVDIITGRKSILDYILKPIIKAKHIALSER